MVSDVGKLVDVSALFIRGVRRRDDGRGVGVDRTWAVPPVPPEQVQFVASVQIVDDVPFHVHAEFAASALGATKVAATSSQGRATTIAYRSTTDALQYAPPNFTTRSLSGTRPAFILLVS